MRTVSYDQAAVSIAFPFRSLLPCGTGAGGPEHLLRPAAPKRAPAVCV